MNKVSLNNLRNIGLEYGGQEGLQAINHWIDAYVEHFGISYTITQTAIEYMTVEQLNDCQHFYKKASLSKLGIALEPFCNIEKRNEYYRDSIYSQPEEEDKIGEVTTYKVLVIKE